MDETFEYSSLGSDVVAFTTHRTLGRDRRRLCQMLNIVDENLIIPHQVHSDKVLAIDEKFLSLSTPERKEKLEGIDAVITSIPEVCIGVSTADCIPVLIYDNKTKSVAAIHAGWRGTVSRISRNAIRLMKETYGSKPDDMRVVIGPGISIRNFEIGDEVYNKFVDAGFKMRLIAEKYKKWHIDLWEANRQLLIECGVREENIHIERICTYDNTDSLFSARVEQQGIVKCGRNFNAIMLKAPKNLL